MKLIVGLGNYEEKYRNTRHNAGFMVVDAFVDSLDHKKTKSSEWKLNSAKSLKYFWVDENIEVIKPQTHMNGSGRAVRDVMKAHNDLSATDILVIHDDWSFPVGEYKTSFNKGANGHNGVQNIIDVIGTREFWRLRLGIQSSAYNEEVDSTEFVLSRFSQEERQSIKALIEKEIIVLIHDWIHNKIQ